MRMRVLFVIGVVLGLGLIPSVFAQSAVALIDASAKAMGTTTLQSIQYSGTGTNNSVGQVHFRRTVATVQGYEVCRVHQLRRAGDAPGDRPHRQ